MTSVDVFARCHPDYNSKPATTAGFIFYLYLRFLLFELICKNLCDSNTAKINRLYLEK
jgi:hypothetical protein